MEGQYIAESKNQYVDSLITSKKINESGRILQTSLYEPIFYPQEVHPESSPNIANDLNLPLEEIANDMNIIDKQLSLTAFNIRNFINTTVERLNYSKRLLIEEMQRKQDSEILCKKYDSFIQVVDLGEDEFSGNFHADGNIFSAKVIGQSDVDYEIVSVDGNGYEGNKYVLTEDNKFLQNFIDTSNRNFIKDKSYITVYEYSRITANDSERIICPDINKDSIEAKCVLTLSSEKSFNCLKLLSDNQQLKLNEVLVSEDGIRFTEVFKNSIDINNINNKIDIVNYIPKSGLICFPSTNFVRISLESNGYTGDKLGFEATGIEDEFEKSEEDSTSEIKQVELNHILNFKVKSVTNSESINKNNICITNQETNEDAPISIKYDKKSNIVRIEPKGKYDYNTKYLLTVQNLKDTDGKNTGDNFKIFFTTKDRHTTFYEPKYFIKTKQKISLNLGGMDIDPLYLTHDYVYVLNYRNEIMDVDFESDKNKNRLVFYPKKSYDYNSEYRLYIANGTKTLDGRILKDTYCMKFKTQESVIDYKSEIYFASTSKDIEKDIKYDLDLNNSYAYVIDKDNNIIDSNIQNSKNNSTALIINTSNMGLDENYYCIVEGRSKTQDGKKINKQIVFKINTETEYKNFLEEEMFVPTDKIFKFKIGYNLEKSYTGPDYIYVLDKNFNKLKRCVITFDNKEKEITVYPPRESYLELSDYYIVVNKDALTTNLRSINKTIIKHFKTISDNYTIKSNRYFLNSNEDINIETEDDYSKFNIYLIDANNKKLDVNIVTSKDKISIKHPITGFNKSDYLRLVIENNKQVYVHNLFIEPKEDLISPLPSKYFISLDHKFLIGLSGKMEEDDLSKYVYILNDKNEKIKTNCINVNKGIQISPEEGTSYNPETNYKIVIDKDLEVNNFKLNRYITCDFVTRPEYIKKISGIDAIHSKDSIKIRLDEEVNPSTVNNDTVYIINSNFEKVDTTKHLLNNNTVILVEPKNDKVYNVNSNYKLILTNNIKTVQGMPTDGKLIEFKILE